MASLASLLPSHLCRSLAGGMPERTPHAERFSAALLLSDISGFTALTERLQARGREGAEEVADVVNQAFAPAIRAIEERTGSIVSFGGDSLFTIFVGAGAAARAVAAAAAIEREIARLGEISTSSGPVALRVSQAIHHGEVLGLHLGTGSRRHYVVTGPPVRALARLAKRASGGPTIVSSAASRRRREERTRRDRAAVRKPPARSALLPYVPDGIAGMLRDFEGGFRRVVVLFFETRGHALRSLQSFHDVLDRTFQRYDGLLLKSDLSADGVKWLCIFGIPRIHEDDATRAARAALEVIGAAPRGLGVRAGLHAGVVANVIVGGGSRWSFDVVGDVVNTAARVLGKAAQGEALVTEEIRRGLSGVETVERGMHVAKGKRAHLGLHALKGVRTPGVARRLADPIVGRTREIAVLTRALGGLREGSGFTIGISGEAGIGKSRLMWEASRIATRLGIRVHEGQAEAVDAAAYRPIAAIVRGMLDLPDGSDAAATLHAMAGAASRLGLDVSVRHHVGDLLGVRYPRAGLDELPPRERRAGTMAALRALCVAMARDAPRLLVLEDMHWAEELTREAVDVLSRAAPSLPMGLLLLHRPSYTPPAGSRGLRLGELGADEVARLVAAMLGRTTSGLVAVIRERCGGNPFYVEEVVRQMLASRMVALSEGGHRLVPGARPADLPEGIEAVVGSRLDRVSRGALRIAQHAAVLGRAISAESLAAFSEVEDPGALEELVEQAIMVPVGDATEGYAFRHSLVRDVTYGRILARRRRELHRRVVRYGARLLGAGQEAALGHHSELAGDPRGAATLYLAAADAAEGRFANEEAARLFGDVIRLSAVPTAERAMAHAGRARARLQQSGRFEEGEADNLAAIHDARAVGDRRRESTYLCLYGTALRRGGRFREARERFDAALAIAREIGWRDEEGSILGNIGNLHYERAELEEARRLYEQSLAIAESVGDTRSIGITLGNIATLESDYGDRERAEACYQRALELHRKIGNRRSEGIALGNLALLRMELPGAPQARELMEGAIERFRETGDRTFEGMMLDSIGTLQLESGELDEARTTFAAALAIHRELLNPNAEGKTLFHLAQLDLFTNGVLDDERFQDVQRRLERDRLALVFVLCARGHVSLAAGRSGRPFLDSATALARELGVDGHTYHGDALAMLRDAEAAFAAGRPLVRGYVLESLTEGQQRWLREHRPEVVAPSPVRP